MVYKGWEASGCWQGVVAQWLEHWQLKSDVLGFIPSGTTFFTAQCRFKCLWTVTTPIVSCFDKVAFRSSDVAPSIGLCCASAYYPFLLNIYNYM